MLISNAYAQAASGAAQDPTGGLMGLLPLILMFVVLWFLMIRPQMKRAKEHKSMVEALAKGDEVVTQGGVAGRVAEIGDNFVHLEVAEKTNILVQKQSIATVLPKGTLKTL
ncbi:preprotein translocase subunit YajC [Azoarcus sp. DD4]|uniref:preprotein translocase subunit YajC n=1 Tax=Azoarcus sp. DD4 TaxID=2027405 RepID=UPI0011283DE9|nr:preprotein translocase subunit YajC [Azoarcus sp. DD4]MCM2253122.1 preprotein translocase subunit YajC [Ramlibacter sp.]QDF96024.1 preprotein translocase subunit YajC [Azoarcus sp. DD4]